MQVLPFAQAELSGTSGLLARLFDEGADVVSPVLSSTTRTQYVTRILAGLAKLRDKVGPAFRVGVVFHMGERGHHYDDRLIALPIDQLWAGSETKRPYRVSRTRSL